MVDHIQINDSYAAKDSRNVTAALITSCLLTVSFAGCATTPPPPRFFPASLIETDSPETNLAILQIYDHSQWILGIDGVKVPPRGKRISPFEDLDQFVPDFYVTPGDHEITYIMLDQVVGVPKDWVQSIGNTHYYSSFTNVLEKLPCKCSLSFEAGKKYSLRDIDEMLWNAGNPTRVKTYHPFGEMTFRDVWDRTRLSWNRLHLSRYVYDDSVVPPFASIPPVSLPKCPNCEAFISPDAHLYVMGNASICYPCVVIARHFESMLNQPLPLDFASRGKP